MRRPLTTRLLGLLAPLFFLGEGVVAAPERTFTVTVIGEGSRIEYENSGAKEQGGDMPWISRDGNIRGVFYVKDAGEAPMVFDYLRLFEVIGSTETLVAADEIDKTITADLMLWSLDLAAGPVGANRRFIWELRFRELISPFWTVARYANEVAVANPLPNQANWRRLDLHLHTFATDTQFEFGLPVSHMASALTSVGLDGAFFTDHGESMTDARWATQQSDCTAFSNANRLLRAGEEATADDDFDNDFPDGVIHLVCFGLTRPLKTPAEYFSANRGFQLWTLPQLLDSLETQSAVAFAAHPASSIELFEYNLVASWPDTMFALALNSPSFLGVEFYNQRITKQTDDVSASDVDPFATWTTVPNWQPQYAPGMRQYQWLAQRVLTLAGGDPETVRKVFFCGGSDAHGDLNYKRYNALGQFDVAVNDDAAGKIQTALLMPGGLTEAEALAAMRAGRMIVSDGPLVVPQVRLPNSTVLPVGSSIANPTGARLELHGVSTAEFGPITEALAIRITPAAVDTIPLPVAGLTVDTSLSLESLASTITGSAVVIECRTSLGYRSVANPFWVGPATATDVAESRPPYLRLFPNPIRQAVTIRWAGERPTLIELFDARGRVVWWTKPMEEQVVRSTADWPAGVYFFRAQFRDRTAAEKLTIVR